MSFASTQRDALNVAHSSDIQDLVLDRFWLCSKKGCVKIARSKSLTAEIKRFFPTLIFFSGLSSHTEALILQVNHRLPWLSLQKEPAWPAFRAGGQSGSEIQCFASLRAQSEV
jgi:hypothetical protein